MLAKEFRINSAGEEEQPNANKASTCDSNVEHKTSLSCEEAAGGYASSSCDEGAEAAFKLSTLNFKL